MPTTESLLNEFDHLRRQRPDWSFSDILKKHACESYLRRGNIDAFVRTLIPLAEEFEDRQSSKLKDHPLALMKALADALTSKHAIAKKYSPDQPRVPAGSPGGGQWTSGGGGISSGIGDLALNTNFSGTLIAELPRTDFLTGITSGRWCVYQFDTMSIIVEGPTSFACRPSAFWFEVTHGTILNDN